jgi:pimeloyl-ACP methyl ester carboxylesterase/DNA-binding CsgD family transcriptional regulator
MDIPPVNYVETTDGYEIAYTDCGAGEPLVFMPVFLGHVRNLWSVPGASLPVDLASRFRLISFDARGQGASSRGLPATVSLDDFLLDLDAVVRQAGIERFVLMGGCHFALEAAHYAARHPERVRALILVNAAMTWDAWRLSSVYDQLPVDDWEMFLYNVAIYNLRPHDRTPEMARPLVDYFRESMTQQDYLASVPAWHNAGLEGVVSQLRTPTLVLHSRNFRLRAVDGPLELVRRLPNARMTLMEAYNLFGERGQAVQAIDEFLAQLHNETDMFKPVSVNGHGLGRDLPPRQLQVLRLIAEGKTNGEIADELVISLRTVERHIGELYAKLGVRNRVEAATFAMSQLANA